MNRFNQVVVKMTLSSSTRSALFLRQNHVQFYNAVFAADQHQHTQKKSRNKRDDNKYSCSKGIEMIRAHVAHGVRSNENRNVQVQDIFCSSRTQSHYGSIVNNYDTYKCKKI